MFFAQDRHDRWDAAWERFHAENDDYLDGIEEDMREIQKIIHRLPEAGSEDEVNAWIDKIGELGESIALSASYMERFALVLDEVA